MFFLNIPLDFNLNAINLILIIDKFNFISFNCIGFIKFSHMKDVLNTNYDI
jgi:hypothetical protein